MDVPSEDVVLKIISRGEEKNEEKKKRSAMSLEGQTGRGRSHLERTTSREATHGDGDIT